MRFAHSLTALVVLAATATAAVAAPTTIRSLQCTVTGGDDLSATIRYTENASGRTLDYRFAITDGVSATSSLRDSAGRVVASGTASAAGHSVSYGSTWSSTTYRNLLGVLDDSAVQSRLGSCAAALPFPPGFPPRPTFCPILVFVWDEDLVNQLCGWLPPVGGTSSAP